jgi:hypothetical protein
MSRHRVVAAAVVAAAALGVPGSALAVGSAGQGSKSTTAPPTSAAVSKAQAISHLPALAASAGLTESQFETGLAAAKRAGGNSSAGVAAFARATGVSPATARRLVSSVFGPAGLNQSGSPSASLAGPAAVAALATHLGISTAAAHSALEQIAALGRTQGIDPASAAFAAIAHHVGVSPAQLAAALPFVKEALRGASGG